MLASVFTKTPGFSSETFQNESKWARMCPFLKVYFPFQKEYFFEQLKMGNIANRFDQELQMNEVKMKMHISVFT